MKAVKQDLRGMTVSELEELCVGLGEQKYRAKQNKDFGKIYVGAVLAKPNASMEFRAGEGLPGACGHILAISNYQGADYTYYFGTGWSRNPATDFQSMTSWEAYLSRFAEQVQSPLKVKF